MTTTSSDDCGSTPLQLEKPIFSGKILGFSIGRGLGASTGPIVLKIFLLNSATPLYRSMLQYSFRAKNIVKAGNSPGCGVPNDQRALLPRKGVFLRGVFFS